MSNYCTKAKFKAREKVLQMWLEVNRPWPHLGSLCAALTLTMKVVCSNKIWPVILKDFSILSKGRLRRTPAVACSRLLEARHCQLDFLLM